jgi:hypothetical protein
VPCDECPWLRDSLPGFLGPHDPATWRSLAHSDQPIACHKTIKQEGSMAGTLQCAGAAIYRGNVCKSPRDPEVARAKPDHDLVFSTPWEFIGHHEGEK